jgi:hypothetical protein
VPIIGRLFTGIETLMNARANTPEGDKLDLLVTVVEAYEAKRVAAHVADPFGGGPGLTAASVPLAGMRSSVR